MRKVQQEMINAIRERKNFKRGNVEVAHSDSGKRFKVFLFGNLIAEGVDCGIELNVRDAGWQSASTKSYLDVLIGNLPCGYFGICQRKGQWYLMKDHDTMIPWEGSATLSIV